jgi:2-polyprenyl-3-methyl-5-hydroxy-6-metoxy-1,4-benzoquinol methylase
MDGSKRLENLAQFYLSRDSDQRSLFEVWEAGDARGDSVTPSTYSTEYRRWITDKLITTLDRTQGHDLLSLGCGNAMVEADIVRKGFRVLAVDALPEAVELARAKSVEAECADITEWSPDRRWPVIYMDGLAGHLYDAGENLRRVLTRIRSWLEPGGSAGVATLMISNDAPKHGSAVQAAPGVAGFHWLSGDHLRDEAMASGFDDVFVEQFSYQRPQSGERVRALVHASVRA